MRGIMGMLAAGVLAMVSAPAMATTWTTDYTFTATFDQGPYSTLSGNFALLSDSTARTNTVTSINFSIGDYAYRADEVNTSVVPGFALEVSAIHFGRGTDLTSRFFLSLWATPLVQSFLIYDPPGSSRSITSSSLALTQDGMGAELRGVPEPSTWALAALGFGAIGGAMRRRRTRVHFA